MGWVGVDSNHSSELKECLRIQTISGRLTLHLVAVHPSIRRMRLYYIRSVVTGSRNIQRKGNKCCREQWRGSRAVRIYWGVPSALSYYMAQTSQLSQWTSWKADEEEN